MQLVDKILEEFRQVKKEEELEFYSQAFLALSAVQPELVEQYLTSTRVLHWFKSLESDLSSKIKDNTFQFFYELKTLQVKNSQGIKHFPLISARKIIEDRDLDSSIEGIISKGFLVQPETYKVIQLSLNL